MITDEQRDDDLIDTDINGYRVVEAIGRGGMGAVYRATQPVSGAEVAIKVLARELIESRESSERFVNEARLANRVRHEGLVKVLFVGLLDDGRPYLIMEHLTGTPLSALIGTAMPLGTLLRRLAEAARAIAAMHEAGVIHRDLKPGNLFVTTAGYIKVLDFGIAKLADERSGLTRTGHTIGTPGYMSPEQAEADPLDGRTDVYSLGVVLYECVVGRRPFEGRVVEALSSRERPPPLPDRVPRELDAIVQRAMSPDRRDRFATMAELASALDEVELPADAFGVLGDAPLAIFTEPTAVTPPEPAPTVKATNLSRLGRYIVEGTAGRGGEGVVLIGHDPKVQRKVALKLLDAGDRRDRVIAEAQAMARVSHPNVVTLYELGEDGDKLFLVMEYLEAIDLENWLGEDRAWREIVEMFVAAGRGLAAAHAVGVVHRDFKPANVLLGKDGRPRVGDFGIAEIGPTVGNAAGTAAFMAPEQVEGGSVDARADQFAFCAALWRAIHREPPYPGATAVAIAMASQRGELCEPKQDVPSAITAALKRGLAAAPADRFADMTALLAALERALAPRNKWPFAVLGIVAAGTLAVIATRSPTVDTPIAPPPTLAEIRAMPDAMDQLRALGSLPLAQRWVPEARMLARHAVVNGFVHRVTLDADPIADAASFSRDGTLVVPTATTTIAIAPDRTQRTLPAPLRAPRRVFLAERELRILTDDSIFATPLDRAEWKTLAHCDYSGTAGKQADANDDLTILACVGLSSRVIVDGVPGSILITPFDAVAFSPDRRIAVRRTDEIEVYEPTGASVARRSVAAMSVAIAGDLVAYVADRKPMVWDLASNAVANGFGQGERIELTRGEQPLIILTGASTSVLHVRRTPLSVIDIELLPGRASIAGARVVERASTEVVVRDFIAGRAWRQAGSPAAMIADAHAEVVALFDKREVRLWTVGGPAATTISGGLAVRMFEHSLIVTGVAFRAPLRAYAADGALQDRIDADARILDSRNSLLVLQGGKTVQWLPEQKRRIELAADGYDYGMVVDGELLAQHASEPGKLLRIRDGAVICPGPLQSATLDGSVVLILVNGRVVACRPRTKATVELAVSFQDAANTQRSEAIWMLHRAGRIAGVRSAGKLRLFDTQTGAELAIASPGFPLEVKDFTFSPTSERVAIVAEEGLFIVDGGTIRRQGPAVAYRMPRFLDDNRLVVLQGSRIVLHDLTTRDSYDLGSIASPDDQKNSLFAFDDHAIATTPHTFTGVSVSVSTAPPDIPTVESWFLRVSGQ